MGLDDRRCLRPLLRLRCCCGFLGFSAAYMGGKKGKAWPMGGWRGGAGASWRYGLARSSSRSSPKRSASLMKELGVLRYPSELPVGQDG